MQYDFTRVLLSYHNWVDTHGTNRGFFTHNFKSFGYANEAGLRRRFKRDYDKQGEAVKTQIIKKKNGTVSLDKSKSSDPHDTSEFISPLDNDEWIIKYCGYEWKRSYLTIMRELIWNSLKLLILLPRGLL